MRRAAGWLLRIIAALAALAMSSLAALLIFVHTDTGRGYLRDLLVRELGKRVDGAVSAGELHGSIMGRLELRDVRIVDRDGVTIITVETIAAEFSPWQVLGGRLHFRRVQLHRPRVVDRGTLVRVRRKVPSDRAGLALTIESIVVDEGHYHLARSALAPIDIEGIHVAASLHSKGSRFSLDVDHADGRWAQTDLALAIRGRFEKREQTMDLSRAHLQVGGSHVAVDLGRAMPEAGLYSASFRTKLCAAELRQIPGMPEQWIADVEGRGTIGRGGLQRPLTLDFDGRFAQADLMLRAHWLPAEQSVEVQLRHTELNPADIVVGLPAGALSASLHAQIAGSSLDTMIGSAILTIDGEVAEMSAEALTINAQLSKGALSGRLRAQLFRVGATRLQALQIDASMPVLDRPWRGSASLLAAQVTVGERELGPLSTRARIDGVEIDGRLRLGRVESGAAIDTSFQARPDDDRYRIELPDVALTLGALALRGRLELALGPGDWIQVETLELASSAGKISGSARWLGGGTRGHAQLRLERIDLTQLASTFPELLPFSSGTVSGRFELDLEDLEVTGELAVARAAWRGSKQVVDFTVDLHADRQAIVLSGRGSFDDIGRASARVEIATPPRPREPASWRGLGRASLRAATVELHEIDLELLSRIMPPEADIDLRGRVDGVIEMSAALSDFDARLRARGFSSSFLPGPVEVTLEASGERERVTARARVTARDRRIMEAQGTALGGIGPMLHGQLRQIPIEATLAMPDVPLPHLFELLGVDVRASGAVSLQATMRGALAQPEVGVEVTAPRLVIDDIDLRALEARGSYSDRTWHVLASVRDGSSGALQIDANGGLDRQAPLSGVASVENFQLGMLTPLWKRSTSMIRRAEGMASGTIQIGGSMARPELSGELAVRDGELRAVQGIPRVSKLKGRLRVTPTRWQAEVEALTGRGRIRADATVEVEQAIPRRLRASIVLDNVPLLAGPQRVTASARIGLEGKLEGRLWRVDARIADGRVTAPKLGGRDLHPIAEPEDVRFVRGDVTVTIREDGQREPSRTIALAGEPTLRLAITAPGGIRIRGDGGLRADAMVDLVLTHVGGAMVVEGRVEIPSGQIELFDRSYQIERAAMAFDGQVPPNPSLDLLLFHDFDRVTVFVAVSGTMANPRIELSSTPAAYSQSELLGFVLGGRPGGADRGGLTTEAMSVARSFVGDQLEGLLARGTPIDVLRITTKEGEVASVSRVTLGKWVGDRLFVAYQRDFNPEDHQNANEALFEFTLSRRWRVEGAIGDRGAGVVDILWVKRY